MINTIFTKTSELLSSTDLFGTKIALKYLKNEVY